MRFFSSFHWVSTCSLSPYLTILKCFMGWNIILCLYLTVLVMFDWRNMSLQAFTISQFISFVSTISGQIRNLLIWIKDNLIQERPELFLLGDTVWVKRRNWSTFYHILMDSCYEAFLKLGAPTSRTGRWFFYRAQTREGLARDKGEIRVLLTIGTLHSTRPMFLCLWLHCSTVCLSWEIKIKG